MVLPCIIVHAISALAVFSRNALYKSTFYFYFTYLLTVLAMSFLQSKQNAYLEQLILDK